MEFLETAESRGVPAVGEGYQDEEHEYEGSLVGAKFSCQYPFMHLKNSLRSPLIRWRKYGQATTSLPALASPFRPAFVTAKSQIGNYDLQ